MNIEKLNKAFAEIVEKKSILMQLESGSEDYVSTENLIEEMKQEFLMEYGSFMEEALFNIHDEHCPDNAIKLPLDYMASSYEKSNANFEVSRTEGVEVDADDLPGVKARLVLLPNPTRMVLQSEFTDFSEVVWKAS